MDPGEWWPYIAGLCQGGRRVVLIAPNGAQFATLTSFWGAVDAGLFRVLEAAKGVSTRGKTAGKPKRPWLGRMVLKGMPTIIGARTDGGSLTILSAGNYADVPAQVLAQCVGVRAGDTTGRPTDGESVGEAEYTYCLSLTRWFRRLIVTWVGERCGPWGDTAGALGVSIWRATDGPKSVARHDNDEGLEIETNALHGGRASVWYYGEVGSRGTCPPPPANPPPGPEYPGLRGQCHKIDVRSMYPWILGNRVFPVQFRGIKRDLTPAQLQGSMRHWGGIAEVTLKAAEPEYPYRIKDRTRYPVGTFRTTLAGPELLAALTRGEVIHVHRYARYRLGTPFVKWSEFVLGKRAACRASGDLAGELLWKLCANSFGGKFAQRKRRWLAFPRERAPVRWGEYLIAGPDGGKPERRRALQGIPHRLVEGGPGARLPAAVFAYLTAFGRLYMRGIRTILGREVVVSQDTDGLWLTDEGLSRATSAGLLTSDAPGSLRLERSVSYARWWDARHYYAGGEWTLAGVATGWTLTGTATARERRVCEPTAWGQSPDAGTLLEWTQSRRLDSIRPDVPVGPDGWALDPGPDGSHEGPKRKLESRGEGEVPPPLKLKRRKRDAPSFLG